MIPGTDEEATTPEGGVVPIKRIPRYDAAGQARIQELELLDGETPIRYRDIQGMFGALQFLARKHLPTSEARTHIARCMRVLKDHLDDFGDEKRRLEASRPAEDLTQDSVSASTVAVNRQIMSLSALVAPVRLPTKVLSAMLPQKDKEHPKNEEGLAAALADLMHLYPIDLYPAAKKTEPDPA